MAIINQLYATLADLAELGPPVQVIAMKPEAERLRALRAGSADVALYLRKRHKLPLAVELEEVTPTGLAGGSVAVTGDPEEAFDVLVRVTTGGAVSGGATAAQVSNDGGYTWGTARTLPASGFVLQVTAMTITFSGTLAVNDSVRVRAGVDYSLRQAAVAIAAYKLVYNRGVDPESRDGQELRTLYQDAIATAKAIGEDEGRLEGSADATPALDEAGPRWTSQANPWDFMSGTYLGDDA
ncbi:hypothetical protein WMF01_12170 [Sorangium sp. So ce1667]